MKALFLVLLALNLGVGAWLLANGPADLVHEPARLGLQVLPEQFHPLTDAEVARRRSQAEQAAGSLASAAAAAAPAAIPASAPGAELPQADCGWIVGLASDGAARKLQSRLFEAGVGDKLAIAIDTEDSKRRLHLTGMDAAAEERVHEVLREFPKLGFEHCIASPR
jgi:hypothetical protein